MELIWLVLVANGLIFGFFCSYLAGQKGKESTTWFWLGFVFNILALLVLVGLPSKLATTTVTPPTNDTRACPHCAERIKLEAKICRFCQREVATDPIFSKANELRQKEETARLAMLQQFEDEKRATEIRR